MKHIGSINRSSNSRGKVLFQSSSVDESTSLSPTQLFYSDLQGTSPEAAVLD